MKIKTCARLIAAGTAAVGLAAAHPASATVSIGINLGDESATFSGKNSHLSSTQFAGVVSQDNWNNYGSQSAVTGVSLGTLVDSTGAATGVTSSLTAGGYYTGGTGGGGTVNPSNGDEILNSNGQYYTNHLTLSNIPYASYSVYVYTLLDQQSTFGVTLTPSGRVATTLYGTAPSPKTAGYVSGAATGFTYIAAKGTTVGSANAGADYALFTGLTSSSFTASVGNFSGNNPAFDGIEIVDTAPAAPEPSQVGMLAIMSLGLGGLMLRARRRSAFTAV